MLTLGEFREMTKELGDDVQISAMGAEVSSVRVVKTPEGDTVLVLDEDDLEDGVEPTDED